MLLKHLTIGMTLIALAAATARATVRNVDADAPAGGDGNGWAQAFKYLQDALGVAEFGDEIRVAEGVYRPDENEANPDGTGNREASFALIDGVIMKGGYAGLGAPDPDERDPAANPTVLSGDIGIPGDDGDNSYQVVTAGAVSASTVLDGFCITGGNAEGPASFVNDVGGGMYLGNAAPAVVDCIFVDNSAERNGGGMYCDSAGPAMTNCAFLGNQAGGRGGAMATAWASTPTLINCLFSGNAGLRGGAIYNEGANALPALTNCSFSLNYASINGGGIYNLNSNPMLANCILWGNSDNQGTGQSAQIDGGTPVVSYSCIQDSDPDDLDIFPGTGNIDDDPLFVDPDGQDDATGTADDDLRLSAGSPCADAGDNEAVPSTITTDLDGNPRFLDDPEAPDTGNPPSADAIVDMGAYERMVDCNDNGFPDDQDIAEGTSLDCNENGVPDECDIAEGTSDDCQPNGIPDECDLGEDTSLDCNENSVPDECDIAEGTSDDCQPNGIPDECDLGEGTSLDCNENGVPDECDVAEGTSGDCQPNGIPDECDLSEGISLDCNENGVPDECDIAQGTSEDANENGIPDECEQVFGLDIKPGSCPNSVNRNSHGVLPVALVGTDDFDVTTIDLDTVRLSRADGIGGEVAPHEGPPGPHSVYEDVATPFAGQPCGCHEAEGDGFLDLSMKLKTDDVVTTLLLNDLEPGALVELVVTGNLLDGSPFAAGDCIRLVPPSDKVRARLPTDKGRSKPAQPNEDADTPAEPAAIGRCGPSALPVGLLSMSVLCGAKLVRQRRIRRPTHR